ncbi:MAG: hypothetical protein AB8E15_01575 [Bdellovibrionales bacterium]
MIRSPFYCGAAGLLTILFSLNSMADRYFETQRKNSLTPNHCQELDIVDFNGPIDWVSYSVKGGKEAGFTDEINIGRHEAGLMWRYFKAGQGRASSIRRELYKNPRTKELLDTLEEYGRIMDYDYKVEGEILEVLSLVDLANQFNPNEFFFTGGYAYSNTKGRVVGELDIIVGRRSDCRIVVVGESKLGISRLGKAKRQLQRFRSFKDRVLSGGFKL